MKRFLIIYPGALGDTLLTRAAILTIKKTYPGCAVDYAGNPGYLALFADELHQIWDYFSAGLLPLFSADPELEKSCRNWLIGYDCIIFWTARKSELQQKKLAALHVPCVIYDSIKPPENYEFHQTRFMLTTLEVLKLSANVTPTNEILPLQIPDNQKKVIPEPFFAIHPGSGSAKKNLPVSFYIELAEALREKLNMAAVCTLGPAEESRLSEYGKGDWQIERPENVQQLANLIGGAGFYIGNDSGVTHLAAQLGIPTFAIFVASNPQVWAPIGREVYVLHQQNKWRRYGHYYFLHELTPESVGRFVIEMEVKHQIPG